MEAHILNVFSMGAFVPVPGQEFYCASKAAVKLLTDGLHSDLKNTGIGLFVAFMGAIATEITLHSGVTSPDISRSKLKNYARIAHEKAAAAILKVTEHSAYQIFVDSDSK